MDCNGVELQDARAIIMSHSTRTLTSRDPFRWTNHQVDAFHDFIATAGINNDNYLIVDRGSLLHALGLHIYDQVFTQTGEPIDDMIRTKVSAKLLGLLKQQRTDCRPMTMTLRSRGQVIPDPTSSATPLLVSPDHPPAPTVSVVFNKIHQGSGSKSRSSSYSISAKSGNSTITEISRGNGQRGTLTASNASFRPTTSPGHHLGSSMSATKDDESILSKWLQFDDPDPVDLNLSFCDRLRDSVEPIRQPAKSGLQGLSASEHNPDNQQQQPVDVSELNPPSLADSHVSHLRYRQDPHLARAPTAQPSGPTFPGSFPHASDAATDEYASTTNSELLERANYRLRKETADQEQADIKAGKARAREDHAVHGTSVRSGMPRRADQHAAAVEQHKRILYPDIANYDATHHRRGNNMTTAASASAVAAPAITPEAATAEAQAQLREHTRKYNPSIPINPTSHETTTTQVAEQSAAETNYQVAVDKQVMLHQHLLALNLQLASSHREVKRALQVHAQLVETLSVCAVSVQVAEAEVVEAMWKWEDHICALGGDGQQRVGGGGGRCDTDRRHRLYLDTTVVI